MKRFLYIIIVLAAISCTSQSRKSLYKPGVSQQLAQYRKELISDLEYTLHFSIPQEKETPVEGKIKIGFNLEQPQETIIDFRKTENVHSVQANGTQTQYELLSEHIIIPASATVQGTNEVEIVFTPEDQSLNRNDEFLYTLLVPDRARTLFPCFDQPDLKASFNLSLQIPAGWVAVSNSPQHSQHPEQPQQTESASKHVTFNPTEPLSTYLFSFVAGKFTKETYTGKGHTFAAYHRETEPYKVAQLPTIFKQVAMSLDWMEDYTGVPYPFAKYDFIILPGFQYGGMEHTGATLYNDTRMFLSKNPTPDEELRRAALIAHETAHMWFGDFVTMKWFDDVWTKEVFASYFGQKITEPMYPEINHQLNWLKSITTSALGEDRTLGGTAIKQPLDNLSSAGLVYNNIIYNKAPVMLKKLVEIMGEEAFRAGIHDYLVAYSYGNATWDDLVKILDSKTGADLVSFSDVWVNSNGMPWLTFSLEDDTLTVSQSDPYGRGLLWPQSFNVALKEFDQSSFKSEEKVVEVVMDRETVKIPVGRNISIDAFNCDGRGYGYFRYDDPRELEFALDLWYTNEDEVSVQSQLMNLYEAFQHGELPAEILLERLMCPLAEYNEPYCKALQNPLIASTVCNYISALLSEAKNSVLERGLLLMSQDHPIASYRLPLLRALISNASDSLVWKELHSIWSEASHPLLSENDYMTLAWELAIRNPHLQQEIIATQSARILNPDRKRQFEFISRATTPDVAAQEELFRSLLQAENRRVEPWALKTLSYLCHPLREEQAVKYIRPALDSLPYIQRTSDIFFPMNWTRILLGRFRSPDALEEVEKFLADNPDFPPLLKSKILQAAWNLQRRNKSN